jgi:hypothetical protein
MVSQDNNTKFNRLNTAVDCADRRPNDYKRGRRTGGGGFWEVPDLRTVTAKLTQTIGRHSSEMDKGINVNFVYVIAVLSSYLQIKFKSSSSYSSWFIKALAQNVQNLGSAGCTFASLNYAISTLASSGHIWWEDWDNVLIFGYVLATLTNYLHTKFQLCS